MSRKRKLLYNTLASLMLQVVTLICGFILPRQILVFYGSKVNGLMNSITQFLEFVTLCECGLGSVVQSAFYEPLAKKSWDDISRILVSSEQFFRKIAYVLIAYTLGMLIIYPHMVSDSFKFTYTVSLILVIAFGSFVQYFFGVTYRLLLTADQMGFIPTILQCVSILLNTICCILLIFAGAPIHIVKLITGLFFIVEPFLLHFYVVKHYHINRKIELIEEPIKQKWNGFAQHVASVVLSNTDVTVLTLFSSLQNVSVYGVYNLITNGVRNLIVAMMAGVRAMIGNMLAKGEHEVLGKTFHSLEWAVHTATTLLFALVAILIVPFVSVYTKGIHDAQYIVPLFGMAMALAQALRCIQLPYVSAVFAAGHYRQTQMCSVIEVIINIVVSVVAVFEYDLVGVAIGTAAAIFYKTCYLAWYISRNIIPCDFKKYVLQLIIDLISAAIMIMSTRFLIAEVSNYFEWVVLAFEAGIVCLVECAVINMIVYHKEIVRLYHMLRRE